jgi:hypothetical protein
MQTAEHCVTRGRPRMCDVVEGRKVRAVLRLALRGGITSASRARRSWWSRRPSGPWTAGLSDYLVAERAQAHEQAPPKLIESDEFGGIASAVDSHWWREQHQCVHAVLQLPGVRVIGVADVWPLALRRTSTLSPDRTYGLGGRPKPAIKGRLNPATRG